MSKRFLPEIGAHPGKGASPVFYVLLGLLALAVIASTYLTRFHWISDLQTRVVTLETELDAEREARKEAEEDLRVLTRQVTGLGAVNGVELIYGAGGSGIHESVKLPYRRQGSVLVHNTKEKSLYYFTSEGETIGDIASHPRTLGAYYLWPILRDENRLEGRGDTKLPGGTLLKVPTRLGDWRVRSATTTAGTPDKVRALIFEQAGIE